MVDLTVTTIFWTKNLWLSHQQNKENNKKLDARMNSPEIDNLNARVEEMEDQNVFVVWDRPTQGW